eukprot:scaffold518_cov388-Prasinococcus_capsulatus_cf.AAC.70
MVPATSDSHHQARDEDEGQDGDESEDDMLSRMAAAHGRKTQSVVVVSDEESEDDETDECLGEVTDNRGQDKTPAQESEAEALDDDALLSGMPASRRETKSGTAEPVADGAHGSERDGFNSSGVTENEPEEKVVSHGVPDSKMSKAKARKARNKARSSTGAEISLRCQICAESFPSRNALFKHIRETGHAAYK